MGLARVARHFPQPQGCGPIVLPHPVGLRGAVQHGQYRAAQGYHDVSRRIVHRTKHLTDGRTCLIEGCVLVHGRRRRRLALTLTAWAGADMLGLHLGGILGECVQGGRRQQAGHGVL